MRTGAVAGVAAQPHHIAVIKQHPVAFLQTLGGAFLQLLHAQFPVDRLGQTLTAELLLTGRLLDAPEAHSRGVVARVVPAAEFEQRVAETVQAILVGSPLAARRNKAQIRLLVDRRDYTAHDLDASFDFLQSDDHREGLAAFIAKRLPKFRGK